MMIALLGGTGKTGGRVLTRALAAGHQVRVLVRDPSRLRASDAALDIVSGDVLDAAAVDRLVAGADVVLSLFGHVKDSPATLQTDGTRVVVEAMKRHGVSRIVTLSGGGLRAHEDRPGFADRAITTALRLVSGPVLADAVGHLEVLRGSGLEWTVVRAPRLTEAPGRGRYRVGWVGVGASTKISRDDLADFILTQIDDRRFIGAMPFVSE